MKSRIILLIAAVWLGCLLRAGAIAQWPLTVTNIAELKSLSVPWVESAEWASTMPSSPAVYVLGYYSPGDRGGGMFEWNPNSSATPDGGRYITTNGWTSGNGRWVRMLNGEKANVRMWGATGNGFTDDTAAIQNAINACTYSWTWSMLFPSGTYSLTNTIVFPGGLHIQGEGTINNTIVTMHGTNDVFRTINAQCALTNGPTDWDHNVVFEEMSIQMDTNSTSNAGLVLCRPGEASTIRDIVVYGGGYGIRVYGGGAPGLHVSHVHTSQMYVAGICVEGYLPNGTWDGHFADMHIDGPSGDHHRADSDTTASLVLINHCDGVVSIRDFKAEGSWGGGLFCYNRSLGSNNDLYMMGSIMNIDSGGYNCGYPDCDFVVLRSIGAATNWTASVTIHPVNLFGIRHLIRDEATGRNIDPALYDLADTLGLNQSICHLPVQYQGYAGAGSRFVIGNSAVSAFLPTTTNAWYRIVGGPFHIGGRFDVIAWQQSSEVSIDINPWGGSIGAEINLIRSTSTAPCCFPAPVTQVRAGSYWDPSVNGNRPFVDIYVDHAIVLGAPGTDKILIQHPLDSDDYYNNNNLAPLLVPAGPVTSLVPAGCTLNQCVTNTLIR